LLAAAMLSNQAFRLGARAFGLQFHPEVRPADARSCFEARPTI